MCHLTITINTGIKTSTVSANSDETLKHYLIGRTKLAGDSYVPQPQQESAQSLKCMEI